MVQKREVLDSSFLFWMIFGKYSAEVRVVGTVFQIQRFSLYDGPGVRTVVFLKGCPLRCPWCHNPEGLGPEPQILFDSAKCIGCMDCVSACPLGCHRIENGLHVFDRARCIHCGLCAAGCCTGALSLSGVEMEPETVMEQVLRDQEVYAESGGGLTISGGEPFFQADFTLRLLRLAKEKGLHTTVETSGFVGPEVLRRAAADTDLFLYDYKVTGETLHRQLCGVSNQVILSNLTLLDTLDAEVILRCPVIPGYNDTEEHLRGIGAVSAAHPCIRQVHLEPYHRLGVDKARLLGLGNAPEIVPPDRDTMEQYRQRVQALCGKPTWISN